MKEIRCRHSTTFYSLGISTNNRDLPTKLVDLFVFLETNGRREHGNTWQDQLLSSPMVGYLEGEAVISIDRLKKTVTLADGRNIRYSKLVLADFWLMSDHQTFHVPKMEVLTYISCM